MGTKKKQSWGEKGKGRGKGKLLSDTEWEEEYKSYKRRVGVCKKRVTTGSIKQVAFNPDNAVKAKELRSPNMEGR